MTSRERVEAVFNGAIPDRVPMTDPFWQETLAAWHKQGLPRGIHPADHFGFDTRYAYFLDTSPQFANEVLERTAEHEVRRDAYGRVITQLAMGDTPPMPVSWALHDEKDWPDIASRLQPGPDRISFGYYGDYLEDPRRLPGLSAALERREQVIANDETFVLVTFMESYETAMRLMGDENLLITMAIAPGWVREVFETIAAMIVGTLEILLQHLPAPHGAFLGGDIAYKNGPLFSPAMYRDLLMPAHQLIFRVLHANGLRVIYHTDGNFLPLAEDLMTAGIDCIQPLESNAGIAAAQVKAELGSRVVLMGNMSVPELCGGRERMLREINGKLPVLMRDGGYIYSCDHSIPPTMTLDDYAELVDVVKREGRY